MMAFAPEISVIIPMYNVEKFIAECLESFLVQTFTNFEVIVVDDCSTDSSYAIVESYAEKFGGRLTLTRLQKNSGNAGYTARNRGFSFSRGEYVFFVDADDFIIKTALEKLYTAAKNFDADVVYTGSRYRYTTEGGTKFTTDRIGRELKAKGLKDEPTFTLNDPHKQLQELLIKSELYWTPWTKFVRRNFLTENGITFCEIPSGGDYIWTIELFACAERFLRIPDAFYMWRDDSFNSMTRSKRPVDKQISIWSNATLHIARAVKSLFEKHELLNQNPLYRYFALMLHFDFCIKRNFEARLTVKPEQIFDILRLEFERKGEVELIIPFMFSIIDSQQKHLIKQNNQFRNFALQAQAQVKKLNQHAAAADKRIAELEAELKKLKS